MVFFLYFRETDKTILENCKVHGIKEKTFVRIAKEIGNVSARQVIDFEHKTFEFQLLPKVQRKIFLWGLETDEDFLCFNKGFVNKTVHTVFDIKIAHSAKLTMGFQHVSF